jgi:hypothetical protein
MYKIAVAPFQGQIKQIYFSFYVVVIHAKRIYVSKFLFVCTMLVAVSHTHTHSSNHFQKYMPA